MRDPSVRLREGLIEIGNNVFDVFNSDTQSDGFRCNSSLPLTFR